MAGDKLLSQMNALSTPALTDILYAINAAGTSQGKRTLQDIANLFNSYANAYVSSAVDAALLAGATIPLTTLGESKDFSLGSNILVAEKAGIYDVSFSVVCVSTTPTEMQTISLVLDGVTQANGVFSEDYTGTIVNVQGRAILDVPANGQIKLVTTNGITWGNSVTDTISSIVIKKII